ncbi:centrosomal of 112 kDa-like isoform X1 isoform B [Chlorella sorokiniana]|uniref:Centrosomal of 112 kDa-like isoform X1 isoform B n=1 Tax=Chlorella sorokiniana TaxID=3076 RepID=A0A2P6TXB3_CHLSO|nr:centrosomal of 112 kDa-like isoform X1 isoform B [Chlorella sorokiniana]|eukprot:PRW58703.1 centrosomal of 112 kDa-like isoform X1 isoform B [Chlorella sorokiniana]
MKTVPAASAAPQQQAYARAYRDVTAHVELDEAFAKLRAAAESHAGLLQKQAAVRVRNWLKKLSEETANVVWKRNRNAYARLLVEQLRCGKLVEPFTGQPPGGPLPTLPKHLAYAFKPPRSSPAAGAPAATAAATSTTRSPGAAQVALALQGAQAATQQALSQQARSQGAQQQSLLSASEQLDEYLGRADFRRAEAAEEEAAVASAFVPREALVTGSLRAAGAVGSGGGSAAPQLLPGTRMQLRGAEGRRVDRHQLGDVGWQPSKLELEAQLGASRERQAELEWRLAAMETLLKQHSALLAPAVPAAPLGSLLDAIDDGHVSPPRSKGPGKQELDELIQRYEAKRQQWRSPAWAAGGASSGVNAGGSPRRRPAQPPLEPSDEAEILQQLDAFQQQTETIRRALGGGAGIDADGALVAEVRQLRSKLLQSLQKHAPELEAAGVGSLLGGARSSGGASKLLAPARQQAEHEAAGSPGSSWRLAAGLGDASPPATSARSCGMFRLTDQSSLGGEAWPPATAVASSSKFRLTDDSGIGGEFGGGRQRLSNFGGSFGGTSGFGGLGSCLGGTPASALAGPASGKLARLGSMDSLGSLGGGGGFSLEAFEAQTEALRRQLAGL